MSKKTQFSKDKIQQNLDKLKKENLELKRQLQKQGQITKSLKEKEILLKEIHHRVKNNMQIISSLLNLQAKTIKDQSIQQKFYQCRSRIKAMALVHDRLYRSSSLEKINFSDYIETLAVHLMSIHESSKRDIKLDLDLDELYLDIKQSIPLGLITNELISNSFKHAFPEQSLFNDISSQQKKVHVALKKKNKTAELLVRDNGIGLPENYTKKLKDSLGMNLVHDLVSQLRGEMKMDIEEGTAVKIHFSF
ncbi:MAG: hypothetical protein GF421_02335 [Candidatus Aminicenantes bacterium]|nr:hypothetical protein [Candidatus Aminicenantes bacterium]